MSRPVPINQVGSISANGVGGGKGSVTESADRKQIGNLQQTGNIILVGNMSISGNLSVAGTSHANVRSGGKILYLYAT